MARRQRVQYPGAIYHVMSRGDRREATFRDDQDRRSFIRTLGETCAKTGWGIHAYVLLPNHFHLVNEPSPLNVEGWTFDVVRSDFLTLLHAMEGREEYRSLMHP